MITREQVVKATAKSYLFVESLEERLYVLLDDIEAEIQRIENEEQHKPVQTFDPGDREQATKQPVWGTTKG